MSRAPTANDGDPENDSWRFLTHRAPCLRLRIVGAPGQPDRATLYPADAADIDRMETWLTVDASVVEELSAWR